MGFLLLPLRDEDVSKFKKDMQDAFQQGALKEFNVQNIQILPEKDIDDSLAKKTATAYKAVEDGKMVGGAIVNIDEATQQNELDFLYVKHSEQSRGVGQFIWCEIERLYPKTKVWKACTPYVEKRNIHFYINCLGFHAVEFFNPKHKRTDVAEGMIGGDCFLRFEKVMNQLPLNG